MQNWDIAEVIGAGLKISVVSLSPEQAKEYFGMLANLVLIDPAASSALTRQQLAGTSPGRTCWPTCANMDYSVA
jgi:hypothetical protein